MSAYEHRFAPQMTQLSLAYPRFDRSLILELLEDQEGDVSDVRRKLHVSNDWCWSRSETDFKCPSIYSARM